ncbi:hypothetical protein MAPG_10077 [Magnaporthiopsis poae ATCC 64411]|uniref:Cnl2/NKP2 family protein n=1 Tax=Magnaporthiopsis poae (strain ATCC 64411 / 73-15) TaxID=644358 RepID=A0A0C4EBM5_MAGP6|nr:hypothetical protein MAPG_10077 [Magnaporthiopsis poae ATCC 64411]
MAPTESTILSNYLLVPAQLPTIISLDEFRSFFPPGQRSSPQVRTLYRDLQRQRNSIVDDVADNIDVEAGQHARAIRRQVARIKLGAAADEVDPEDEVEKVLLASEANGKAEPSPHTLSSVVTDMEAAATALERQIQDLQDEEAEVLQSIQQTVGDLSDLRYGRLANPRLSEQVLDGLRNLQAICEKKP